MIYRLVIDWLAIDGSLNDDCLMVDGLLTGPVMNDGPMSAWLVVD